MNRPVTADQLLTTLLHDTMTRRRMLISAGIAGASLTALGAMRTGTAQGGNATPMTDGAPFAGPVDVLNYALTLEHLESAFYRDGLAEIGVDGIIGLGF